MHVTVLDTETGQIKESKHIWGEGFSPYWWSEGNGGCDCNRRLLFDADPPAGTCVGSARYLITDFEAQPSDDRVLTLEQLNCDYPEELRLKFLPQPGMPADEKGPSGAEGTPGHGG